MPNPPAKPQPDGFALTPAWATIVSVGAGATVPLAFSPFGLFPLAVLAPAVLFWLWLDAAPRHAAWYGFAFGFGMFGFGVSWVYVSLHTYGNMPMPLAALAVALFVAVLAAYPALLGWSQARLFRWRGALFVVLVLPAGWVLGEWVRGWFLSGFPWLHLGYSQIGWPLSGFAPWSGVYGVSLAVAVSAGLVLQAWRSGRHRWLVYASILGVLWTGAWVAGQVDWVRPAGTPVRVVLVQGNVSLRIKWVPEYRLAVIRKYIELSARAPQAQLVVWPESAVPGYLDDVAPEFVSRLQNWHRENGTDFLVGVVEQDRATGAYYNSVVSIGAVEGAYRKRHLVPFGEFLPFPFLFRWLIDYLHIPMSDFSPGSSTQAALSVVGQKVGVSVCYEDAFGAEVIQFLPQATLLVNVSEDAWFGDSLAPHQRLQMARMRARETGRPMLRAANTGPSAVIDHEGRVQARSPQFKPHVLTARVQRTEGATPYVRFGDWPVVLLATGLFMLGLSRWNRAPTSADPGAISVDSESAGDAEH